MRREEKEIHVTGKQKGWEREVVQDRGWCGEHDVLTGQGKQGMDTCGNGIMKLISLR